MKADQIRDISEKVYRKRLGPDDTARMLAKDKETNPKDKGDKLRARAGIYDSLVSDIVEVLGIQ